MRSSTRCSRRPVPGWLPWQMRPLQSRRRRSIETRDPARAAWLRWTPQRTARTIQAPGAGMVRTWCQVTPVDGPFVDFRWTFEFEFEADGARLVSSSRLRFRGWSEIDASLACSGFVVVDVLDAPDRPGEEWVLVARARGAAV